MRAQHALADMLADLGTTHFFHVPVFSHHAVKRLVERGVVPVVAHGEKAAAYMADGYARISGRPGVCAAQAVGGANLAAGLRDARLARVPIIALTGGDEPSSRHKNVYQEHDDMPVFDALTKFNTVVDDGTRLPELLRQAYRAATTGAPGPVHLQFAGPTGGATDAEVGEAHVDARYACAPAYRPPAAADVIAEAAAALTRAARPLALLGGGVARSGAQRAVAEFLARQRIPAVASLNALGVLAEGDDLWAGIVGSYARDEANLAVAECDLLLVLGSSLGSMTTREYTVPDVHKQIVHVDIDPSQLGRNYPASIPLAGDVHAVVGQLDEALPVENRASWLARISALRAQFRAAADEVELADTDVLRPQRLWRLLSDELPDGSVVVGDTGHVGAWSARHLRLRGGQTFLRTAGSLGWALPASIGVKCAVPDRPVICLTGDGGLYYHLAELETARRYGVAIVVVVNNNFGMNQEAVLWRAGTAEDRNWQFTQVDLAAVARSLGCGGWVVERAEQFSPAFAAAVESGAPAVIDVRTDPGSLAPTIYTERA